MLGALDAIGPTGVVLVLGTVPPALMREFLSREAGVLDGIAASDDFAMLRCFLSLQDKNEVGWATAIFKTSTPDSKEC